jgi:hypothetical protein
MTALRITSMCDSLVFETPGLIGIERLDLAPHRHALGDVGEQHFMGDAAVSRAAGEARENQRVGGAVWHGCERRDRAAFGGRCTVRADLMRGGGLRFRGGGSASARGPRGNAATRLNRGGERRVFFIAGSL